MDTTPTPTITKDLVLIGGGHSHLEVIRQFGMQPIAGLRITVLCGNTHTPYSGMMPGMIAGHYTFDDAHIDLRKLCEFARVRLFNSNAIGIDLNNQTVRCDNRTPLRFDWLSINTGSQPDLSAITGAAQQGFAVKPINQFLAAWQGIWEQLVDSQGSAAGTGPETEQPHIAVVGGGAASIEVALACQYQLHSQGVEAVDFSLITAADTLLPSHNKSVRRSVIKLLAQRQIKVETQRRVMAAHADKAMIRLEYADQVSAQHFDHVIWALHAGSHGWLQECGLACDKQGFIRVRETLQSVSHEHIFAAGDAACFEAQPLAKSGVYAVRAGKTLSHNLRAAVLGKSLKHFKPQKHFLSLLMTGNQGAIASRGNLTMRGDWLWRWKDSIDRKFMRRYQQLPAMDSSSSTAKPHHSSIQQPSDSAQKTSMRCGGCGAKVGQQILNRVIAQLQPLTSPDSISDLNSPDDAAVLIPPIGKHWLQTVDYFRAFIDDPYLLGRIATNHCLSDIYAMGGIPHSALAIATVTANDPVIVQEDLLQLMQGAVATLNQHNTALIGGHSSEGAELGFGLTVNGTIEQQQILGKATAASGQQLILTKAIGTGTLLAANMAAQCKGQWLDKAVEQMLVSNREAAAILQEYAATACTDITGFGLAGHLLEMLQPRQLCARLDIQSLPILEGAETTANHGWLSSLHPDNLTAQAAISNWQDYQQLRRYPLLFDPQTSGGLLAAVPADKANDCIRQLQHQGYVSAAIVGELITPDTAQTSASIQLSADKSVK